MDTPDCRLDAGLGVLAGDHRPQVKVDLAWIFSYLIERSPSVFGFRRFHVGAGMSARSRIRSGLGGSPGAGPSTCRPQAGRCRPRMFAARFTRRRHGHVAAQPFATGVVLAVLGDRAGDVCIIFLYCFQHVFVIYSTITGIRLSGLVRKDTANTASPRGWHGCLGASRENNRGVSGDSS